MPVLLTDLDDTVFPFSHTYRTWLKMRHGRDIPQWAWDAYEVNEASMPGHQARMEEFFADPWTLEHGRPSPEAFEALQTLSSRYAIVACTARYAHTEAAPTRAWLSRHLPWVRDVVFTAQHASSPAVTPKGVIAQSLSAVALIDDRAEHLARVASPTRAVLVQRPDGVPSEPGALSWSQVVASLL